MHHRLRLVMILLVCRTSLHKPTDVFLTVFSLVCLAIAACRAAYSFARKIFSPHAYIPKSQKQGMRVAKSNAEWDLMRGFTSFFNLDVSRTLLADGRDRIVRCFAVVHVSTAQ